MSEIAAAAVGYAEILRGNGFFSYYDEQPSRKTLKKIEESVKKDYFTPFEREDILMLALLLSDLADETYDLLCFSSGINTGSAATLPSFLSDAVNNIKDLIISLSKFPKTNDFTSFFEKWEKISSDFGKAVLSAYKSSSQNIFINKIIGCMDHCRRIMNYTQYAIIKNS